MNTDIKSSFHEFYLKECIKINETFNITPDKFPLLVTKLIEKIEENKNIESDIKDDIVKDVLVTYIKTLDINESQKEYFNTTMENLIALLLNSEFEKFKQDKKRKNKKLFENFDEIYLSITKSIDYKNLNAAQLSANILTITLNIMKIIEQYPNIKGAEKKQLVVKIVNKLLKEIPDITEDQINNINLILPNTIDMVIEISKGKYKLKQEDVANCLITCLTIFANSSKK